MIDFTLTNFDQILEELVLDTPAVQNQNKQAFDTLYEAIQEIGTITTRAIKDGKTGHKKALHKIMEICRDVE